MPRPPAERALDVKAGLDTATLAAGRHERVVSRCVLEPANVWQTRVADRT